MCNKDSRSSTRPRRRKIARLSSKVPETAINYRLISHNYRASRARLEECHGTTQHAGMRKFCSPLLLLPRKAKEAADENERGWTIGDFSELSGEPIRVKSPWRSRTTFRSQGFTGSRSNYFDRLRFREEGSNPIRGS